VLSDGWSFGTRPELHVVEFGDVVDDLRLKTQPKLWQLTLKRLMYRAADLVAHDVKAQVLVTGEALGQVSSQTLRNLAAIDGASELPVFRPLIGYDKMDIIELARRIGTEEISAKVKEYCAIAPGNPATGATRQETEEQEKYLDGSLLEQAVRQRRVLDLKSLRGADLVAGYLFTDEVPREAVVLDLRPESDWVDWHYPGSVNRESWELTANPNQLDRDRTYVVHCGQGTQAALVAEVLQRAGIEAYAYRGGTRALKRDMQG
jgi:tRNA uracil 4-sulfurtransferase